jgi:hypothetical protein
VDFFGGTQQPNVVQELGQREPTSQKSLVILSDVWLDKPTVLEHLAILFEGYETYACPDAFIFMGNFISKSTHNLQLYKSYFDALGALIAKYPGCAQVCLQCLGGRTIFKFLNNCLSLFFPP